MNFDEVLNDIRSSFGGLWLSKQRGNSLEIITPYVTTNNKFISVFITEQGSDFFITDGGWINSGMYDVFPKNEEAIYLRLFYHFQNAFDVKEVLSDKIAYYYVKANNPIDIPSRVLAFSTFIQNIVSVSEIEFEDKKETETKQRFFAQANEYLKSFNQNENLRLKGYLFEDRKDLRFNAIYNKTPNSITLINYITGSTFLNFANSIFKTNTLFEMASGSELKDFIRAKVSIIDTTADGYLTNKIGSYLLHLEKNTDSRLINWHEREQIKDAVFEL